MDAATQQKIQEHDDALADHSKQLAVLHEAKNNIEKLIQQHDKDITDIKVLQATMATKDDVHGLSKQVDATFNGLLKDAYNSIPLKHANIIQIIIGVIALLGVIAAFLALAHGGH